MCKLCLHIKNQDLMEVNHFAVHRCELKRPSASRRGGWACDGARILDNKMCPTTKNNYSQSRYLFGYRCGRCDFDLCLDCCLFWKCNDPQHLSISDIANNFWLFKTYNNKMSMWGTSDLEAVKEAARADRSDGKFILYKH